MSEHNKADIFVYLLAIFISVYVTVCLYVFLFREAIIRGVYSPALFLILFMVFLFLFGCFFVVVTGEKGKKKEVLN